MFSAVKSFSSSNILSHLRSTLQSTLNKPQCGVNYITLTQRRDIHSTVDDSESPRDAPTQQTQKRFSSSAEAKSEDASSLSTNVMEEIQQEISNKNLGRLFAVVHVDGHQRKVTTEDIIVLSKHIEADIGERIRLNKVMLVGGKDFTVIGKPVLSPQLVKVEASVLEKTFSQTIISSWYHKRRDIRKLYLRKLQYTMLRINKIEISGNKLG